MEIDIPGFRVLTLSHLVLDYNGTLAIDGLLIPCVGEVLNELSRHLAVHVVTADTFGRAKEQLQKISCTLDVLGKDSQGAAKQRFVRALGAEQVAAVGNGRNDRLMVAEASLGIAVVQAEGAARETCLVASIICPTILDALGLLQNPRRLIATLRD
ncbi:MAG: ATPase P [Candidatus Ozemobacteraceae bacterium]